MNDLLTPKQVAQAIGVSESSLKRWCDRGLIETVRTPGGHRRMSAAGVMEFLRGREQPLVRPEVLGLPSNTGKSRRVMDRAAERFHEALAAGDEEICRQVVFDLYLAEYRLSRIFDQVVAPAFHQIGERWKCQQLEVFQERLATEIGLRLVGELRRLVVGSGTPERPKALGGTCAGDPYQLPTSLVELALRECGWEAVNLGASLPFTTLESALVRNRPRLFWLSVSVVPDEDRFVEQYNRFLAKAEAIETAVAVGGQGLHEPLRRKIRYSAHCTDLEQLQSFADSLCLTESSHNAAREAP